MQFVYRVIRASACKGTHHRIAMDALEHLRGVDPQGWIDVFLSYHRVYLEGSKAPDNQFKDFKNHVLHVREGYWGGAVNAAKSWYEKTVTALRSKRWSEAAFNAGVLSHYVSDPLMPLHTGQSETEGKVHRALEWSVACSYDDLIHVLEVQLGGFPRLEVAKTGDWLGEFIRDGARRINAYYDELIDHYDLERGVKDPPLGLDPHARRRLAECLGLAIVGFARILERAIEEADHPAPLVEVTMQGVLAAVKMPIRYIARQIEDAKERDLVMAMYDELQRTGKVVENLPEDDKTVRKLHAEEVLRVPLAELDAEPTRPTGTKYGTSGNEAASDPAPAAVRLARPIPAAVPDNSPFQSHAERAPAEIAAAPSVVPLAVAARPVSQLEDTERTEPPANGAEPPEERAGVLKFRLHKSSPVQDGPSIGNKTAERLRSAGVHTVGDLLGVIPEKLTAKLGTRQITPTVIRTWQAEAALVCRVPELRGHDAQILVGSGLAEPAEIAECAPEELLHIIEPFVSSADGQRVLRGSKPPDLAEVTDWIAWSRSARTLKAA